MYADNMILQIDYSSCRKMEHSWSVW